MDDGNIEKGYPLNYIIPAYDVSGDDIVSSMKSVVHRMIGAITEMSSRRVFYKLNYLTFNIIVKDDETKLFDYLKVGDNRGGACGHSMDTFDKVHVKKTKIDFSSKSFLNMEVCVNNSDVSSDENDEGSSETEADIDMR